MKAKMSKKNQNTARNLDFNDGTFRCLIAGGGTGGHLFPAIAVSRELEKRVDKVDILFVAGHKRLEAEILKRYGFQVVPIKIEGMKGRGWKKGLSVLIALPKALFQSIRIIKHFKPHVVLGVGGYSSGPVCISAKLMGIPTAIHEQNTYPGLTNRILSRVVDGIFASFRQSEKYFKKRDVIVSGNPVRQDLYEEHVNKSKGKNNTFSLLILGGSQGARAINNVIPECLLCLNEKGVFPYVVHQTGELDFENVKEKYREKNLKGEIVSFIEDMRSAYGKADLVVSRAGATTIFELAVLGKPSILVPYPHAANQHQKANAMNLAQIGAAEVIEESDLSGEVLARYIKKYLSDRTALEDMGKKACLRD